ncbi:hypothetical protein EQ500_16065, partial [Lactobacillus sp. XV13L]|nr:hypothetical protein [Lactobacillus sp. XV13L]
MKNKRLMSLGASAAVLLAMAPIAANMPLIGNGVAPTVVQADSDADTTAQYLINQYTSELSFRIVDILSVYSTDVGSQYFRDVINYNGT